MIYLRLFIEFFKTGLFSVGGGLATLPFLYEMSTNTHWFTHSDVADMIAISESTPGAIGINMSTYAGYITAGYLGGVCATLSLAAPSVIIILIISKFLQKFRENPHVENAFYGLAVGGSVSSADTLLASDDHRDLRLAAEDVSCLGYLIEDLIHGYECKVHIHQLNYRAHACACCTEAGAYHLSFGDRCVEASVYAELLCEAPCASEDASEHLYVFAHNEDPVVTLHFR